MLYNIIVESEKLPAEIYTPEKEKNYVRKATPYLCKSQTGIEKL